MSQVKQSDTYRLLKFANEVLSDYLHPLMFDRYDEYLRTRNLSENTCRNYVDDLLGCYPGSALNSFFYFLRQNKVQGILQVNRHTISDYVAWLGERKIPAVSIMRKLSAVRSLFKFLINERIIPDSPIPLSRNRSKSSPFAIKLDKRLPSFLTLEETKNLVQSPDLSKPEGKRDRAWLELLYASGIRVSELAQLTIEQVNLDTHEIRVIGKGSKERVVLMGEPAVKAVHNYLIEARSKLLGNGKSDLLFLTRFGKPMTVRRIQKLLDAHAKSIGIAKRVHPHMVRHTFATHMLDGGADLRVVQELLGHADLSSTQIYTHVTKQQARKLYMKTHPLASESL